MRNDPALLERRMKGGPMAEKRPVQKVAMLGASAAFVALLAVPGIDYRLGWSVVPISVVVAGDVLVVIGLYLIFVVYRENTFTSATVEIAKDQELVSTGPYAIVRHPMYASASLYLLGTPLALGSYWGLVAAVAMVPMLIWRLFDEEQLLVSSLPEYAEYQKRVRRRLIPFVW
jgi:protein-S-isoprenylcysteine O-methyltransferase Ste14